MGQVYCPLALSPNLDLPGAQSCPIPGSALPRWVGPPQPPSMKHQSELGWAKAGAVGGEISTAASSRWNGPAGEGPREPGGQGQGPRETGMNTAPARDNQGTSKRQGAGGGVRAEQRPSKKRGAEGLSHHHPAGRAPKTAGAGGWPSGPGRTLTWPLSGCLPRPRCHPPGAGVRPPAPRIWRPPTQPPTAGHPASPPASRTPAPPPPPP